MRRCVIAAMPREIRAVRLLLSEGVVRASQNPRRKGVKALSAYEITMLVLTVILVAAAIIQLIKNNRP